MAELISSFPAISDLRAKARRRLPLFAREFMEAGTGLDHAVERNAADLAGVQLSPRAMRGPVTRDLSTSFLGQDFSVPFGIAPVGGTGMIWPGGEKVLAGIAAESNLPYTLASVATQTPETIGPIARGRGWFQFYPMADKEIQKDVLSRAHGAGFETLVVTVDVPMMSRRERQMRAGFQMPPRLTPRMLLQALLHPSWTRAVLQVGRPELATLTPYFADVAAAERMAEIGRQLHPEPAWSEVECIRAIWPGKIILKGIMQCDDARMAVAEGADAIWVSNHGGRQLDAAPSSISVLPGIRGAVGKDFPIIFDSGVRSGLDIARGLASGADFVMLGRPFLYALAAGGHDTAQLCVRILRDELENVMAQVGAERPADLPLALVKPKGTEIAQVA
ncbi:alpha-hydroxy acid oxidase [Hoeflea ulvae]|uniref:Alpha-hydroxy-acid oxidizing protein n=1 Tax=Hoeflea ulvae TaxID=2983764 RepID=A0ABT3YLI8_9HYPH|nr:alpha-hydroxy acid oxidase [Hoeflea ulvae]MCY0096742.1 alpha-hydroxy-acid oxidizing protein [Hoeflea ulvae]